MEEFLKHHSTLPNEDLVNIAFFELRKYSREARKSAKSILNQRNISNAELKELKDQIRIRKRKERQAKLKNKNEKYGIIEFVLDLLFSGW